MKNISSEPILALATLAITTLIVGTRTVSMSHTVEMMMLGIFVAGVFAYTGLVYRERPVDERENELTMIASKHAFLVGAAVLSLGIVMQSLNHSLDIWLPLSLGVMVFVKTLSYFVNNK